VNAAPQIDLKGDQMAECKKVNDWREHMRLNVFNWSTRGQVTALPGNVLLLLGPKQAYSRRAEGGGNGLRVGA
jgi:hypothetical protein